MPWAWSSLETVPEPRMVPAVSARVRVTCSMSSAKPKCISGPLSHQPTRSPLRCTVMGRWMRPPLQASPSSSGVSAMGAKAELGLPWKKPKPFLSSLGMRPRMDTSLTIITRRTY